MRNLKSITFGTFLEKHVMTHKTLALVLALVFPIFAAAQKGTVRGFVYDKSSGQPVMFINVYANATDYGTTTNDQGYYSLQLPPGKYTIVSTQMGYDTATAEVELNPGQVINEKLFVSESSISLDAVEISADKQERQNEVRMSVQKITPKDIKAMPSVGGEPDLAQYLQVLPGVVFTGDQGGQLYIRGGSPIQNKVLMDGMIVYNPFHSIGLFSVFETDIIQTADVYTGGFGAEFGTRISSIMDIKIRDGNDKHMAGKVGVNSFGAKAILEGPLVARTDDNPTSVSYLLSAKTSYLDKTSGMFYPYVENEEGLPFSFTDLYGRLSFNGASGSKISVFGFNHRDRVNYTNSKLGWDSYGMGTKFTLIPTSTPLLMEGAINYTGYEIEQEELGRRRNSSIEGFNMRLDFSYFLPKDEIKYGVHIQGFSTDFSFRNTLNRLIQDQQSTTQLAGYVRYQFKRGKFVVDPSFRMQYYASLREFSPEPRLGIKFNATDNFRLKAAGGLFSQNLISANSDRDVVNLFNGMLTVPNNIQSSFEDRNGNVRDITSRLQYAYHAILGFEYDITNSILANVEGYYKYFPQLTELNRYRIFEGNPPNQPDILTRDFIVEDGEAYGLDFTLKWERKNIYVWAVYSVAYVDRWDGQRVYNTVFDRRHNMNFLVNYSFGKNSQWEVSGRWNFGSGFPFTQTQGFYERFDFTGNYDVDLTSAAGAQGIEYAPFNEGRLPTYHRLDLNLKRNWQISLNSELEANIGVTNAYNRENIFYFDRIQFERVNQLPFLPSAGMTLTF